MRIEKGWQWVLARKEELVEHKNFSFSSLWNAGDKKRVVLAAFKKDKAALAFLAEQREFTECECAYSVRVGSEKFERNIRNGWAVLLESVLVVVCRGYIGAIPKEGLDYWLYYNEGNFFHKDVRGAFHNTLPNTSAIEVAKKFFKCSLSYELFDGEYLNVTRQGRRALVNWLRGVCPDDPVWNYPCWVNY